MSDFAELAADIGDKFADIGADPSKHFIGRAVDHVRHTLWTEPLKHVPREFWEPTAVAKVRKKAKCDFSERASKLQSK